MTEAQQKALGDAETAVRNLHVGTEQSVRVALDAVVKAIRATLSEPLITTAGALNRAASGVATPPSNPEKKAN
jgi:hypothetical protein